MYREIFDHLIRIYIFLIRWNTFFLVSLLHIWADGAVVRFQQSMIIFLQALARFLNIMLWISLIWIIHNRIQKLWKVSLFRWFIWLQNLVNNLSLRTSSLVFIVLRKIEWAAIFVHKEDIAWPILFHLFFSHWIDALVHHLHFWCLSHFIICRFLRLRTQSCVYIREPDTLHCQRILGQIRRLDGHILLLRCSHLLLQSSHFGLHL